MSKMNNIESMIMNGENTDPSNKSSMTHPSEHEVLCPKCGTRFAIDDQNYSAIASQVRDQEFKSEIAERKKELEKGFEDKIALRVSQEEQRIERLAAEKDKKISDLNTEILNIKKSANEFVLKERAKANTVSNQLNEKIAVMQKELDEKEKVQRSAVVEAVAKEREKSSEKDIKITQLEHDLEVKEAQISVAVEKAKAEEREKNLGKDKEVAKLTADLAAAEKSRVNNEKVLKDRYEATIQTLKEEIERLKDFKSRLSVKLIGESLENHCRSEFEKIRPYMPNVYFEKDNDVSKNGQKGDFVFRDYDDNGNEYLSIMFEMKNENDDSEHKHKNEDFFAKLDQDRKAKGCKYAVLVTMLEPDSELYNHGIVDVSHKYKDMYVIRPQFFIPMITILRSTALDAVSFRQEVERLKEEDIDVSTFEQDLQEYKDSVSRSHELASKKKNSAIEKIDKAIKLLTQIKTDFENFDKHLSEADNKAQKVTIRTLTKNAPSVREMLDNNKTEANEAEEQKSDLLPVA